MNRRDSLKGLLLLPAVVQGVVNAKSVEEINPFPIKELKNRLQELREYPMLPEDAYKLEGIYDLIIIDSITGEVTTKNFNYTPRVEANTQINYLIQAYNSKK